MVTQLERLARPFPPKYVRAPAKGKFGSYVTQSVVTQALLAIVGPFDLDVGQVFTGEDGKIEGCLVTIACVVDGRPVSVTEVGDCEIPENWKTQGARMKDAISDGVKRCAARLGVGLHLWAGTDFFLYDQLKSQASVESAQSESGGDSSPTVPSANSAGAGSETPDSLERGRGTTPAPAPSKNRIQGLVARSRALRADHVNVDALQQAWNLPDIADSDAKQLALWDELLLDAEKLLEAPFVDASA